LTFKPQRPCGHPGCGKLTDAFYCEGHKKESNNYEKYRKTAHQRGYNSKWRKARKAFLARNPLCVHCKQEGKSTPATVVDHIEPHKGNQRLFWDKNNWQPLCKTHHDKKTFTQDMGSW